MGEEKRALFKRLASEHGLEPTSSTGRRADKRGTPSDHAHNRAIDFGGTPAQMQAFADTLAARHPGLLKEMIYSRAGTSRGGKWLKTGDQDHHDHVHIAWNADGGSDALDQVASSFLSRGSGAAPRGGNDLDQVANRFLGRTPKAGARPDRGGGDDLDRIAGSFMQRAPKAAPTVTPGKGRQLFGVLTSPEFQAQQRARACRQPPGAADPRGRAGPGDGAPGQAAYGQIPFSAAKNREFGKRVGSGVQRLITTVSAPLFPLRDIINSLADENSRVKAEHPNWRSYNPQQIAAYNRARRQSIIDGLANSQPWQAFILRSPGKGDALPPLRDRRQEQPAVPPGDRAVRRAGCLGLPGLDPADAIPGLAQAKVVGGLQKAVTGKSLTLAPGVKVRGVDVQAKAEQAIPALGRAAEGRRAYRSAGEAMSRAEATIGGKAGLDAGHASLAANSSLARKVGGPDPVPPGWAKVADEGPLAGHVVASRREEAAGLPGASDDALYRLIRDQVSPKAADGWRNLNGTMRKVWVSSPKTQINNAVGNYQLAQSAAAINGAEFTMAGYAGAVKAIRATRKGGQAPTGYLKEALNLTDLMGEGAALLPATAAKKRGPLELRRPATSTCTATWSALAASPSTPPCGNPGRGSTRPQQSCAPRWWTTPTSARCAGSWRTTTSCRSSRFRPRPCSSGPTSPPAGRTCSTPTPGSGARVPGHARG